MGENYDFMGEYTRAKSDMNAYAKSMGVDLPQAQTVKPALPIPNADKHSAETIETVMQRNAETSATMQYFSRLKTEIATMDYSRETVYTQADYQKLVNKPATEYTADDIMMLVHAIADKKGKGLYTKDVARVLDTASGGNRAVRQALYNLMEKPFNQAGGQYGRRVDNQLTTYDAKMRDLGIKPNSAEDAAVMAFGEGQYMDKDGTMIPYTMADLQTDFPQTWQKIVEADKLNRQMYDTYLQSINQMREAIYPRLREYAQGAVDKATEAYKTLKKKQTYQQNLVEQMRTNLQAKEELLKSKTRTDTKAYVDLQKGIVTLESRLTKAQDAINQYERRIADAGFKMQAAEQAITSGDILGQKQIVPRQDYYHHVREMSATFDLAGIYSNKAAGSELATNGILPGKQSVGGWAGSSTVYS